MDKLEPLGWRHIVRAAAIAAGVTGLAAATSISRPPAWAFPLPPKVAMANSGGPVLHTPGTQVVVPMAATEALFSAADWRPGDHPPMPAVVAVGRRPDVYACGVCHLADGQGKPENASLAGLSAAYIKEQVGEMRDGRRGSAVPGMFPPALMAHVARKVTPSDLAAAAHYFAGLSYKPWIRVVETREVPRTEVTPISTYEPSKTGGIEPLGQRIVEMPVWPANRTAKDHPLGFIAYAPPGAIRSGQALATTGEGRTLPCASCHGAALQGTSEAPRLAGRSPTYIARQLFDIRAGARRGPTVALMQPVTAKLTGADVTDIAAYLGSLRP